MPQHRAKRFAAVVVILLGVALAQPTLLNARVATSAAIRRANVILDLSLPWADGTTWRLTGGPHSNTGVGKPWSSLDFAGPLAGHSYPVRAAAGGTVSRPCRNLVEIHHAGSWVTSYYHLAGIRVASGQHVRRGQTLGYTSTRAGCGGHATGPHVHFALKHRGRWVDLNGLRIGGWTVRDGKSQYLGCLVRGSVKRCFPAGRLHNFGPA